MQRTFSVSTADGRTIVVHEAGDAGGRVVVTHHGTPSAGSHYAPHVEDAAERGLRLLGIQRPGYGGSSPRPGRTVADMAGDVAAVLDAVGAERFATWGHSGGGPHALACAALLPDRCAAAAAIAGVAPYDAKGLDWLAGQGEQNRLEWEAARDGRDALTAFCERDRDEMANVTGAQLAQALRTLLSPPDTAAVTDRLGDHLVAAIDEALQDGVEGWVDDDLAFLAPWGFDPQDAQVPVLLWQGQQDLMVPPGHGRWLANRIPGVEFRYDEDEGHLSLYERHIPDVHAWLGRYTF
jgi:pimeloyl-ACP methyl ester carboxylesterase